uniref:Small integral membrane protein 8 n=1 Tax=Oncorhynchus tshawytscha TaxID=74940 RepID=A0AAZ3PVS9_ONCTS
VSHDFQNKWTRCCGCAIGRSKCFPSLIAFPQTRCTSLYSKCKPYPSPQLIAQWHLEANKPVMAFGLVTISLCVGYLGYLHATKENDPQLYEVIDSEGEENV